MISLMKSILIKTFLAGLLLGLWACSESEVIPGRVEDPKDPDEYLEPEDKDEKPTDDLHQPGEPYDTYKGLVMAGYQGWFGTPDDGCSHGRCWYHYQNNSMFQPGPLKNSIDFWPDVSEYPNTYKTSFIYEDGSPAYVYSSYDESSVDLHFKWMEQYGIDGVWMQRFVGEVIGNPPGKDHFDTVLKHAMKASNTHQRAIAVMYDLSGGLKYGGRTVDMVLEDARELLETYALKERKAQPYYLFENGKPMIAVWGAGFNDGRQYGTGDVAELVSGLKKLGYSVMLGVPTYWRELKSDCISDVNLHALIRECDAVFPWFVGRYDSNNVDDFKSLIKSDVKWCKDNGVSYAALCFPGFSWRNMNPNGTVIDRKGGQFMWRQAYNAISSGAESIYIAMFDEIDEGTAIFKTMNASDVPSNVPVKDYYVYYSNGQYMIRSTYKEPASADGWCRLASELGITFQGVEDGLPTDHYLWLAGKIRKMLRGEIPLSPEFPASD